MANSKSKVLGGKSFSDIERQRVRLNLGSKAIDVPFPGLIDIQLKSYKNVIQRGKKLSERDDVGISSALNSIFPITSHSGHTELSYIDYEVEGPKYDVHECKVKGVTYSVGIKVNLRLTAYDKEAGLKNKKIRDVKEQKVFLCEMPLMTDSGSFVVNGTERVVVSQLHRSPGVIFEHDKGRTHTSGKVIFSARIIPYRGAWLDFEFDPNNCIYARIDRRRKIAVTCLLRAFGFDNSKIFDLFYNFDQYTLKGSDLNYELIPTDLKGQLAEVDILAKDKSIIVAKGKRISMRHVKMIEKEAIKRLKLPAEVLIGKYVSDEIICKSTGEIIVAVGTKIDEEVLAAIIEKEVKKVVTIRVNELDCGPYIADTMQVDASTTKKEALLEIYRVMRPGEPPTEEATSQLLDSLFADIARYDLSDVGRMKLNLRLHNDNDAQDRTLKIEDIVAVIKKLIDIRDGREDIDDIDNLGNRRIRSVGELIENQFRLGLIRLERVAKERLSHPDNENIMPQSIINSNSIVAAMNEFFCQNPLSQFMDQNNPLSEVTHKRRISALGPGGLTKDRAAFEVRDVHHTHYGRLCPIETPEGPNIGLINSLAIYATPNKYGFLETPFRVVKDGVLQEEIKSISALEEDQYRIGQAKGLDLGDTIQGTFVPCRHQREFTITSPDKLDLVDISPWQTVSVAASLIPFLEHDDANRALMGSNMQRQAVPTVIAEKPLIGTGMERLVATDSGVSLVAKRAGEVVSVDSNRIVVQTKSHGNKVEDVDVDIYNLIKYQKSNHGTSVNQRPIVYCGQKLAKGDIVADGSATDMGELALGRNMLVAFMSWNGYNFEDSIVLSKRVVEMEAFTSVHVQELVCITRETKLGEEEITADIPNVGEGALSKLDESGIVYIGAEVNPGDILVGKVTPKGESILTPEEKLLRAIFGEKASDVKDCSLRVPPGSSGVVTDVQIFTRSDVDKDDRTLQVETEAVESIEKDFKDKLQLKENAYSEFLRQRLSGAQVKSCPGLKKDSKLTQKYLQNLNLDQLLELIVAEDAINQNIETVKSNINALRSSLLEQLKLKKKRIQRHDTLTPGVLKIVKVYFAVKRKVQAGDKMAGRHGNKGVVSIIVPIEDMPHLEDGTPVDVILNPVGVPARMNIGQVLETHLGWAAKAIGAKINEMRENECDVEAIKKYLKPVFELGADGAKVDLDSFSDQEIKDLAKNYSNGLPMASPVFDGVSEEKLKWLLNYANLPSSGKTPLIDGRTGEYFEQEVCVGYMYMLKLNHLVDDKMHARSTGSYSLVTQQPLGGKAQGGGQRFGEMEVWALQAYGAAYTLQEMLTVKSDDVMGRSRIYKNIVDGIHDCEASVPESFNVLLREVRALGIDMNLEQ
jgi:DNA-directed RNA polymerase subunit beta